MYRTALLCACLLSMVACRTGKKDLSTETEMDISDFIASFNPLELPIAISDSQLKRYEVAATRVNASLIRRHLPDSAYRAQYPKDDRLQWHSIGKVQVPEKETYLLLLATTKRKRTVYLLVYDENESFRTSMPVLLSPDGRAQASDFAMDRRYALSLLRHRRGEQGQQTTARDVYVYNSVGVFTLVMTENDEAVREEEVHNPIDSLPRTHPLSGDYLLNRRNFVSIRDGKSARRLQFFLHMEKGVDCGGELRGDLDIVSPKMAQYNRADDHCILELTFNGNRVSIRELQACGNHRSVRCPFSGTYLRRKPAKAAKPG